MSIFILEGQEDDGFTETNCKVCGAPTNLMCWCCEESYCSLAHSLEEHSGIEQEGELEEREDVLESK